MPHDKFTGYSIQEVFREGPYVSRLKTIEKWKEFGLGKMTRGSKLTRIANSIERRLQAKRCIRARKGMTRSQDQLLI
jgi:hypothetical protein